MKTLKKGQRWLWNGGFSVIVECPADQEYQAYVNFRLLQVLKGSAKHIFFYFFSKKSK